jgi:hypothetical protein
MLDKYKLANKVFVPSMGLFIFGGDPGSSIPFSMRLQSLGSSWIPGPDLFQRSNSNGQCLLQVNPFFVW